MNHVLLALTLLCQIKVQALFDRVCLYTDGIQDTCYSVTARFSANDSVAYLSEKGLPVLTFNVHVLRVSENINHEEICAVFGTFEEHQIEAVLLRRRLYVRIRSVHLKAYLVYFVKFDQDGFPLIAIVN
jgi:hypothetical protein